VKEEVTMAETISIGLAGDFEVGGRAYQVPQHFSTGQVSSYQTLVRPVPDIPGGTKLTAEQRVVTETYLLRRAAACVIPEFRMSVSELLSLRQLEAIHGWIAGHRPQLQVV
jgi:hypothetical protein